MSTLRRLLLRVAAVPLLVPCAAVAQQAGDAPPPAAPPPAEPVLQNNIAAGIGYQSANAFRFGRYNGLRQQGAFGIGEFQLQGGDPWDSGGTEYWRAEGLNLGLPSRSFDLRYGHQGTYALQFYYDGVPFYQYKDLHTIYDRSGTGALNGAPTAATPWFKSSALAPFLNTQQLKTQRDVFGGSIDYKPPVSDWQITTSFRHDHKEGTQENSLLFGTGKSVVLQGTTPTAASGNLVFFPQPISYDIDRYDVKAVYGGPILQAEFGYTYSGFTDNNTSFNAIDPFSSPATIPVGTSFTLPGSNNLGPPGTAIQAVYSLPPSNSAHYWRASLGYNFDETTRWMNTFQYGIEMQNQAYPAPTLNPFLNGKGLFSFPGSLNGYVQTFNGNSTLTARPLPNLDVKLLYTIDRHENDTPKQLIQSTYVDAWRNYAMEIGPNAAFGVPNYIYSWNIQKVKAEAGYRILPQMRATLGYSYRDTTRNLSYVSHQTEHTALARLNSALFWGINGNLSYEHSIRNGNYNGVLPLVYQGYVPPITFNNPTAFFEAKRTRDQVAAHASASPIDPVSIGFETRFANNSYSNVTGFGVTSDRTLSVGPDVTWTPLENLNLHLFYTYEQIFRHDTGQISNTNTVGPATLSPWTETTHDNTHTLGLAGDWQATPDLKFGLSYNFSLGDVMYALADGITTAQSVLLANQANVIQPLPNVTANLHSLTFHGEYQFTPRISLWVGTTWERFRYNDFALAAYANPLQYGNSIYPGYTNPSYSVVIGGAAVRIKF